MRPLSPLFIIASLIWILGGTYLLNRMFCGAAAATARVATTPFFTVEDGEFKTEPVEYFSFPMNSAKLNVNKATNTQLQSIATYLTNNPDRTLLLTGTYASKEKNDTDYENLGVARASAIKRLLIDMGAIAENISIAGNETNNTRFADNVLFGGVDFLFGNGGNNADSNAGTTNTFSLTDAFVIPYEGNDIEMEMTDPISNYLDKVKEYLNNNPDAVLMVYGHTDNAGDRRTNMVTSEKVARKVRRFFRNNGLKSGQVKAVAKGPDEPTSSNIDEQGRKQNRRVELRIETK